MIEDAVLSVTNTAAQNTDVLRRTILAAAGKVVEIPEGRYSMQPMVISTPGTHLRFAPGAVLQIVPESVTRPSLLQIGASGVTIEGGQFDGNGIGGVSGLMAIRIVGSHSYITIRNCVFRDTTAAVGAYNAKNCSDWLIEGCLIETTVEGHGIYLHGHPQDNVDVRRVRIQGNTIRNAAANGIWVGNHFSDVTIDGNNFSSCKRMGIEVWKNPGGGFVISGNSVQDCGVGISISGTPRTRCAGNLVARCVTYGIEVAGSRQVTLLDNHIEDILPRGEGVGTKPTGIAINSHVAGTSGDISIQGGLIRACTAAINVCGDRATRDRISIVGVTIKECRFGIRNVGHIGAKDGGGKVEHLLVSGCNIDCLSVGIGNSAYGGAIRSGVLIGNNICVSEGVGIDLFRSDDLLIANNRICGAGPAGIRVRGRPAPLAMLINHNLITGFKVPSEGVP